MKLLAITVFLSLSCGLSASDIEVVRADAKSGELVSATNFAGTVRVDPLFRTEQATHISGGLVSFEAGARTHWHTHPMGQILIVTAGTGRVQQWGGPIVEIRTGDIVQIPPDTKHWHGAGPTTAMSHIAIAQSVDGSAVQWMEAVDDGLYTPPKSEVQPARTRAQELVGEVTPKLADLTDKVLFGDVWARPQLGRRDRSLVTVSALIAMNRPDQLRSHLALARQNGLSEAELSEVITHLAFYAGWPSAMTAAGVAKDVFRQP